MKKILAIVALLSVTAGAGAAEVDSACTKTLNELMDVYNFVLQRIEDSFRFMPGTQKYR